MRHILTGSRLQSSLFACCVLAFGLCAAASAPTWGGDLRPGEAFVVVKVTGDVKSIVFQQFQGSESFEAVRNRRGGVLLRVKPGRYYLKNVTPVHMGIRLPANPEPAEPSQTIAIRADVVNYIGEWNFTEDTKVSDLRYDFTTSFDLITLRTVVASYPISKYNLLVSKIGELPQKTALSK
jgi:hypothetical protein